MNKVFEKKSLFLWLLLIGYGVACYGLSYQTPRVNFVPLISLFTTLFVLYAIVYRYFAASHFSILVVAGVLFRVLLLLSTPNLSDDVYRFIWDGRLAANGINPLELLPADVMQLPPITGITKELFQSLNSPGYYTIYPPVLQGIFFAVAKLIPVQIEYAVIFLKCIILLFECGTLALMVNLLKRISFPKYYVLIYFLNPLVIIELTGNVHFEGIMLFFILGAIALLIYEKWQPSAIVLGWGIATKFIPLIFLPLLAYRLGLKKAIIYGLLCLITASIFFFLMIDGSTFSNLLQSANLFFQKFEFNASIYYIVRWLGSLVMGYNIIAFAGPLLSILSVFIIIYLSLRKKFLSPKQLITTTLFILSIWLLFSTTVHPWYVCTLVGLSVFTRFRFPLVWSFTATWSYAAYQYTPVTENIWLLAIGYVLVACVALLERPK